MHRFILTVLFCRNTSLIFSQASSVTHKFTNEFGNGAQDVGLINVEAIIGNASYQRAPIYHTLASTQTGTYAARARDNQQHLYNNEYYYQRFEKWITTGFPDSYDLAYSYTTYTGTKENYSACC
ncbi:MAG: hypothetical protein HYS25_06800 [Ignavibacteriales bacterium]|nr:hypothetical protein [Ignavibacteriales bacterium]